MNYEDELERSRARKSRRRAAAVPVNTRHHSTDTRISSMAEPGSRASRMNGNAGHGTGAGAGGLHNGGHRRRKNNNKKKKIIITVLVVLFALIAAAAGGAYAYIHKSFSSLNGKNEFDVKDVENQNISLEMREKMEKGYWTIAVFGLDSRDNSTGKGNQSDVIMIINLNRETGEIKLVSVFRDSYLNINDKNTYNKINAAYAQGGPEQAVKALNKNLDLNITHYAAFNWKAVATAINILGGVDIDISKSEFYYINAFITETVKGTGIGSVQLKQAGLNHLDGVQAVAYGRLRLMDSDYARTERQRIVIQKAFEKAKKADLATLNSLVGNMAAMCATNIDVGDVLPMVKKISKYHLGDSMGFPAARGEQKIKIGSNKAACVIPQTLVSNVTSLHQFLYDEADYVPSGTVQTISKKIADISGLNKPGKEIDHVATDKGYVPKPTTAAADETKPAEESTEESSSEGESESSTEAGESGSVSESESSEGESMSPGETKPQETDFWGRPVNPSGPHAATTEAETKEYTRPQSPLDVTKEPEENYGPGFIEESKGRVPEATQTPGGPASVPGESKPTSVIVDQTKPSNSPAGQPTAPGNHPGAAVPMESPAHTNGPAAGL